MFFGVSLSFAIFCQCFYFTIINPPPTVFTMAIKVRESGLDAQGNTFIVPYTDEYIKFRDGYVAANPYWQLKVVFKGNHTFVEGYIYQIRYYQSAPNEPYTVFVAQRVPSP